MSYEQSPQPNPIAQLNDAFRRSATQYIYVTPGVQALPDLPGLVQAVRNYNTFTPDNDPYGEHDSGSIDWHEQLTFWKIDYYDQALQYWHNPLSPECRRVLT